jgi:hypothetical protein
MEEKLLTEDELKYMRMISRYILSMGLTKSYIEMEANEWDNQTEIKDIEWEFVTHFDWNQRVEIPARFIVILQKIFKYIDESGKYEYPDIDGLDWHRFEVQIDPEKNVLTILNQYSYYDEGEGSSQQWDEPELVEKMKQEVISAGIEIPDNGILTARYNGGGDSGSLEGFFDENSESIPNNVEDWCYTELSRNYGGWENNEGGQGEFVFDFNNDVIDLYHTGNTEVIESDTLFEIKY